MRRGFWAVVSLILVGVVLVLLLPILQPLSVRLGNLVAGRPNPVYVVETPTGAQVLPAPYANVPTVPAPAVTVEDRQKIVAPAVTSDEVAEKVIEKLQGRFNEKIDESALEAKLAPILRTAIDRKADREDIDELKADLEADIALKANQSALDETNKKVDGLDNRMKALESKAEDPDTNAGRIAALESGQERFNGRLDMIQGQADSLSQRVSNVEDQVVHVTALVEKELRSSKMQVLLILAGIAEERRQPQDIIHDEPQQEIVERRIVQVGHQPIANGPDGYCDVCEMFQRGQPKYHHKVVPREVITQKRRYHEANLSTSGDTVCFWALNRAPTSMVLHAGPGPANPGSKGLINWHEDSGKWQRSRHYPGFVTRQICMPASVLRAHSVVSLCGDVGYQNFRQDDGVIGQILAARSTPPSDPACVAGDQCPSHLR